MHYLLLTLLSLFLIYNQNVFAEPNTTSAAPQTTPSTTEMYTTLMTATLAGVTVDDEDDPTDDDDCKFELMITLSTTEDIIITICGFIETNDNVKEVMIGITVNLPQDVWVGIGFVLEEDFDSTDPMKNAYSFIVPQYSRNVKEVTFTAKTENRDAPLYGYNGGTLLGNSLLLFEDKYSDGDRVMKLKRKAKIQPTDLGSAYADLVLDYFDFTNVIDACNKPFKIIYAFGKNNQQQFILNGNNPSHHGFNNRGYVTGELDAFEGNSCAEEGDNGYRNCNYIISIVVGVVGCVVYWF